MVVSWWIVAFLPSVSSTIQACKSALDLYKLLLSNPEKKLCQLKLHQLTPFEDCKKRIAIEKT